MDNSGKKKKFELELIFDKSTLLNFNVKDLEKDRICLQLECYMPDLFEFHFGPGP